MRLYGALLRLYPASFRHEYGAEMTAIFIRRRRDARSAASILGLWLTTLADVVGSAAAVHVDLLRQDLRHTARSLSGAKGFALTAVAMVALGIGATTAVFSVADFVLIRPLPFPGADRLVVVWERHPGYQHMELSPANYRDWKRAARSFSRVAAFDALASANLTGAGEPRRLAGATVTSGFLPTLGVQPLLGRGFTPADDRPGAPATVILAYGLWQTEFGGARDMVGRTISLDQQPYTVVGVMPPTFHYPSEETQFWAPLRMPPDLYEDRNDNFLHGVARLKPDVTVAEARAEGDVIAAQLAQRFPKENAHTGVRIETLRDQLPRQSRLLLTALGGAALCILLIACANLANLLLTRALARRHELAVRAAMGAGRERLARQLVTESLVLAAAGGVAGVFVGGAAVPLLLRLVPASLPLAQPPHVDLRVLAFAAGLTGLTGVGFGTLPLVGRSRSGLDALRETARAGGGRRERARAALVVAEIAASIVLLVSAGLLLRALWRVQAIDPGFRTDGVLVVRTPLPTPRYESGDRRRIFYTRVLDGVRTLPGVDGAAYTSGAPMVMGGGIWPVSTDGRIQDRSDGHSASLRFVTPGFFATLEIPLRQGRDVADSDTPDRRFVAVVSESFVRRFLSDGATPVGRRFHFAFADRTVVGVAADIRVRGLEEASEPQVYLPYLQQAPDAALPFYAPKDLVVRSSLPAAALQGAIRAIVRQADPEQPIASVRTMEGIVAGETASRTAQLRVLAAFAAIAFVLAAVGIHGVLAFSVSERTREIGVRRALGAQPGDILAWMLRRAALLAGAGIALGVLLAWPAGRLLAALLAGLTPGDVPTFASVVALAAVMTILGSAVPTVRALRIDPLGAIREG